MFLIDGKARSAELRAVISDDVGRFRSRVGRAPALAVILVGDDPASQIYVQAKERAAERVGIRTQDVRLPTATNFEEVLAEIERLNSDAEIDGILLQLPLPPQLDAHRLLSSISVDKDVDGLHPHNQGLLLSDRARFEPCTPRGILDLVHVACNALGREIRGMHAVVVGRSVLVGRPVGQLLLNADCTVTMCHSKTKALADVCRQADILVAALGRPRSITSDFVKPGAIAIDVGINRSADGTLCGDMDFAAISSIASAITPVPGGVGPMTITMLLQNTLHAAMLRAGIEECL